MNTRAEHTLRYGVAVLAVALAFHFTLLLWPLLGRTPTPLFFAAVIVSAWYGGLKPGLLAAGLTAIASAYLLQPPASSLEFGLDHLVPVGLCILVSLLISSLYETRRRAEGRFAQLLKDEQKARAEAEAANRTKDQFLANISHELRTPLSAILGWVRMLRSEQLNQDAATRALDIIERNAELQAQLVEDLLDVARIVAGKFRLDKRTVDLAPVVEAAVNTVRPDAEAKSIRIQTILDARTGLVCGDPDRLHQVVVNLLSNAVKFTPCGGWINVHLKRVGANAEIGVEDAGAGIAEEFLPHVFERFRQADEEAKVTVGGLGVGLAIVRHLVEMHGGSVKGESEGKGRGATFTVSLPLLEGAVQMQGSQESQPGDVGDRPCNRSPTPSGLLGNVDIHAAVRHATARNLEDGVRQG